MSTKTELVSTRLAMEGQREESTPSRRSPRIRLQIPLFLRGVDAQGAEFIELTKTLNISATGASITSSHLLRIEQTVQITIPAPPPPGSGLVPAETPPILATVLRQETLGEVHVFGLKFLRPLE